MGKIVIYVVLCLVLFAAGLGIAILLGVPDKQGPQPTPIPDVEGQAGIPAELTDLVPADPTADLLDMDSETPEPVTSTELPVAVRGKPLSAEELFRFGAMYREQQEALNGREEALNRRQTQLKLIHDDLSGSRKEYDGLRAEVRDTMQEAALILKQIRDNQDTQQQATGDGNNVNPQAPANGDAPQKEIIEKISAWVEKMPAENAAEFLRELNDSGHIDSAIQFLGSIEERNAAKILAALEDPSLVVQLTEAFLEAKRRNPGTTRQ